ncbi:MAG: AMP-binding protein [Oribacterium sp.]|nr:AMP-binding protein [Oribacterium sp.]
MDITTRYDSGTIYLYITGKLSSTTVGDLSQVIDRIPKDTEKVVLDFSKVSYISSFGLREILRLKKHMKDGSDLTIAGCNEDVLEIFRQTGFDSMVNLAEGSLEESPETLSVKDLFLLKVRTAPQKPFVVTDHRIYTYEDINHYTHILAADLFRNGVHKGTHIGIYSGNSVNWVISFLAAQMLGAIAMPLNFQYTIDDLIQLSGIGDITHLLIGDVQNAGTIDEFKKAVMANDSKIHQVLEIGKNVDFSLRDAEFEPLQDQFKGKQEAEDNCCMLFTSGSTGKPKAVLLSSAGILHSAKCNVEFMHLSENDRICMNVPLFHTTGLIRGFLAALYSGASIHIPENFETGTLLSFIEKQKCTIMNAIPGTIISMVNDPSFSKDKVASLRCSILTGAPATETQMRMLMEKMPGNHFISSYGMSELSPITATLYGDSVEHICRSVGKVADGVKVEILDFHTGMPLPPGADNRGEIVVHGDSAMTAYYKLPAESQALDDKGRIRTGDFGFFDSDGYLHISGRMKELIHCNGKTIEPNAVGSVIAEYAPVSDVKVVGIADEKDGEVAVACISLKKNTQEQPEYNEAELVAFLKNRLSDYQIPRRFMIYDKLPTLANGKVDAVTLKKDAQKAAEV